MAKVNPVLKAEIRTLMGRKTKQLRRQGLLPATMYGKHFDPMSIQVNDMEMVNVFDEVGESGLVDIMVDGKKYPVILRNPQYHPLLGSLIHIDCYKVNLKEKITATVPVEFVGESQAVKLGNTLVEVTLEVEVEALPADLPEKIEVDISGMDTIESVITVADLKVDDKVEIKTDAEQVIVKIEEPRAEEEVETAEVAPGEVPATEQKAPEAEGEAKKE